MTDQTILQQVITIALCIIATLLTRFLPFFIFRKGEAPAYIQYLGKALPAAIFAMLVIYCLKDISIWQGNHGLPEFLGIALVTLVHLWKRQMLLSIGIGTIGYMVMVQVIFA